MLVLGVAVVGIWGTVLYRVVTGVTEPSPNTDPAPAQLEAPVDLPEPRGNDPAYEGRFRDPFITILGDRTDAQDDSPEGDEEDVDREPSMNPSSTPPIRLQLVGIVGETAIVRGRGTTHLVTTGDTVSASRGPVEIRRVGEQEIVAVRGERADTLRLPRPEWAGELRANP